MYKGVTNKRIAKLEENTAEILVEIFHKDIEVAKELVQEAKLGDFIRKHPIALHDTPYDFAVDILTSVEDFDTIEQYA